MNSNIVMEELTKPVECLDISKAINISMPFLISDETITRYEQCYKNFVKWRRWNNLLGFSENVLFQYFEEFETYELDSTEMCDQYTMLKTTININHQIDIKKYTRLTSYIKRNCQRHNDCNKPKTFSTAEVNRFCNEAPNEEYLLTKIALIIGILGLCEKWELGNFDINDVKILDNTIAVTVFNNTNKANKTFRLSGSYFDLFTQYMVLRPKPCHNPIFFLKYVRGKCYEETMESDYWENIGNTVAQYLYPSNARSYSTLCLRLTALRILVESRKNILFPARVTDGTLTPATGAEETLIHAKNTDGKLVSATDADEKGVPATVMSQTPGPATITKELPVSAANTIRTMTVNPGPITGRRSRSIQSTGRSPFRPVVTRRTPISATITTEPTEPATVANRPNLPGPIERRTLHARMDPLRNLLSSRTPFPESEVDRELLETYLEDRIRYPFTRMTETPFYTQMMQATDDVIDRISRRSLEEEN